MPDPAPGAGGRLRGAPRPARAAGLATLGLAVQLAPRKPVPVFPLPSLVLFPRVILPLHVFELRYRTMVREALSGERLIALALLKPGWERDYHGSPEFFPLACLARFQDVEWLPNDCYDLKVQGVARVRLGTLAREYPYRAARAELVPEEPYSEDDPLVAMERVALAEALERWLACHPRAAPALPEPPRRLTLDTLAAHACMAADLPPRQKLELLELDSVLERAHCVGELLRRDLARPRPVAEPGGEQN